MFSISRFPRRIRGLLLLGICLLVLSTLPVAPVAAAKITKKLDDKLPEFTRGTLQRTSLSNYKSPLFPSDSKGAVQLIPVGVVKDWQRLGVRLDKQLRDLGAATIGNTIFALGGLASLNHVDQGPTAEVWSVRIDPTTGAPTTTAWFNETLDLPSVQHTNVALYSQPVAERSSMAVTSVETGPDSGYIYVIGGRAQPPGATQPISSYAVSIATVSSGHITGWTSSNTTNLAALRIPADGHTPTWGVNGLQLASVVSHKIGSNTYVYLIGGLERFFNGGVIQEVGSNQVYYARVRTSDGVLVKPSSGAVGWEALAPLPLPTTSDNPQINPDVVGLWDATAMVGQFEFGDANGVPNKKDVLYVTGGQYQSQQGNGTTPDLYSSAIYRAFIGSDGKLTWTSAAGANQWQGTLPSARVGMGGLEVNGKLYLTGGRKVQGGAQQEPEAAVLTSIVQDDFKLLEGGTGGSNFIYQDGVLGSPNAPRTHHGSVKIQIPVTDQDAVAPAYVYVVAGQGTAADGSDQGSDTLIYAKVGGDEETSTVGFAPSGWYYSTIQETNRSFTGEQVQEIDWTTLMTDTAAMDIEMQYRTSIDNECDNPVALNSATWQDMDGFQNNPKRSRTGANAHLLGVPPPTHCFQYRAKLVNGTSGIQKSTPLLLNVSIQVIIPGSPDLQVQTLTATRNLKGDFTGLNVELLNHYTDTSADHRYPTQPVDVDQTGGSFFVDLFVFGPGQTPVKPTPPWQTNPIGDKACATVSKGQMPVDASVSIPRWYKISSGTCEQDPIDMITLFPQPGNYVVYVVVDSYDCSTTDTMKGCVDESSPGAEDNNVKQLNVTIAKVGYPDVSLPFVAR
jgi:hypothetical protein